MKINYTIGDATKPNAEGNRIIAHVCNDLGGWGRGFVVAISKRWKQPEAQYREWAKQGGDQEFALGNVQFVEAEPGLWVANMIGQHGIRRKGGKPPIRYEAIETCLGKLRDYAKEQGATIHMPRIGAGLAGGDWEIIEALIESELTSRGVEVTVYDLPN